VDGSLTVLATSLTKPVWRIKTTLDVSRTSVLHHWQNALDSGNSVRSLFVDYSKAYDRVDQNILLRKMITLNVPQFAIRWLFSFLKHRIQRVKLRSFNKFSDWIEFTAGMPQGTWLGPLTFVMYIDDLNPQCVVHKFSDDTTLTEILPSEAAHSQMPQYVDNLLTWSKNNCMVINSKKTKEMIPPPLLTISNNPVQRVIFFKLLGINLCNDLRWDAHVDALCSKVASRL